MNRFKLNESNGTNVKETTIRNACCWKGLLQVLLNDCDFYRLAGMTAGPPGAPLPA
jgi:hypothetical protein